MRNVPSLSRVACSGGAGAGLPYRHAPWRRSGIVLVHQDRLVRRLLLSHRHRGSMKGERAGGGVHHVRPLGESPLCPVRGQ